MGANFETQGTVATNVTMATGIRIIITAGALLIVGAANFNQSTGGSAVIGLYPTISGNRLLAAGQTVEVQCFISNQTTPAYTGGFTASGFFIKYVGRDL